MVCTCKPVNEHVRITSFCEIHDPFLRMMRGEEVELVGITPLIEALEADPHLQPHNG